MNAKYSLSTSRKFLLFVGAVLCALPLSAQEVWREGRNIAGLSFYKGTQAEVQLGSSYTSGEFRRPSEASQLWQAGVRLFKGVARSRVYHFVSKSVGRVTPNDGRRQFLRKWGMAPSTFYRFFLKKGEPFAGPLADPPLTGALRKKLFKDRLSGLL